MRTVSWFGVSLAEVAIPRQPDNAMHGGRRKTHQALLALPPQGSGGRELWVAAGLALPFWVSPTNASTSCC